MGGSGRTRPESSGCTQPDGGGNGNRQHKNTSGTPDLHARALSVSKRFANEGTTEYFFQGSSGCSQIAFPAAVKYSCRRPSDYRRRPCSRLRRRGREDVTGWLLSQPGTHRSPRRRRRLRAKRARTGSGAKTGVRGQCKFCSGFGVPEQNRAVPVPLFLRSGRNVRMHKCEATVRNVRACVRIGWVGGIHDASDKRKRRSQRVGGRDLKLYQMDTRCFANLLFQILIRGGRVLIWFVDRVDTVTCYSVVRELSDSVRVILSGFSSVFYFEPNFFVLRIVQEGRTRGER